MGKGGKLGNTQPHLGKQFVGKADHSHVVKHQEIMGGIKQIEGILLGRDGEQSVCIEVNGVEKVFPRSAISKLRTLFDF